MVLNTDFTAIGTIQQDWVRQVWKTERGANFLKAYTSTYLTTPGLGYHKALKRIRMMKTKIQLRKYTSTPKNA